MLKSFWKAILSLILIISIIFFSIEINVLVLEDSMNNKTIYIKKIYTDNEFTVKWMHSVELQPWEEIFKINKDYGIILDRTRFKSFGAGVPAYAGKKTQMKDGYIIFSGINRKITNLQYGISNFAKHTFYFKDKELKLYEIVEDGNAIKIYIDRINILQYFIKSCFI